MNRETGYTASILSVLIPDSKAYRFSSNSRSIAYVKPDISIIEEAETLICGRMLYNLGADQSCIDSDGDGWGWNGVESCLIAAEANECDYSSAAVHNGWGWNSTTDESCPPRRLDYCDYEDTGLNEGWGWNAATRESCPPELQDG